LVEELNYKPESGDSILNRGMGIFHSRNPYYGMALVSSRPLTEMSAVVISCGVIAAGA